MNAQSATYSTFMKLNADIGEGMSTDAELFRWIDMANIACGGHAGDEEQMKHSVDLAQTYGVAVGAHPGYRDKERFGRRSVPHERGEIKQLIIEQTQLLNDICQEQGGHLKYVKPHGALYHDMMNRPDIYEEILQAIAELPYSPALMIMARLENTEHQLLADKHRVGLLFEAFADRAYMVNGDLVARGEEGAMIESGEEMIGQVRQLSRTGSVTTICGHSISLRADSICIHGDHPKSVAAAGHLHQVLHG